MYGLDPDAMIADADPDGVQDRQALPVQNGGARARNAESTAPPEAEQSAAGSEKKPVAVETAAVPRRPFESRLVDGESELLACIAEGWDLVKDLPGERFLIRRKIPRV